MDETFETTDLELAEKTLSDNFNGVRLGTRGQQGGMRMTRAFVGTEVELRHMSFAMTFDASVGAMGALVFAQPNAGTLSYGPGRDQRRYQSGQVFLVAEPDSPYLVACEDTDVELTILDSASIDRLASTDIRRTHRPVRFTGYDPVSPSAAQRWTAICAYVRDTLLGDPDIAVPPLIAANTGQLLAATALTTFPNTALTDPTIEDRHDASPVTLRRAIAFIEDNAHTTITIADIAAAAFVTVRAVQLAFRRHLDTTPTRYLRRVRLDHAHRELAATDPASATVSHVAARWGFHHPGRFAAGYQEAYGVSPSYTLHR